MSTIIIILFICQLKNIVCIEPCSVGWIYEIKSSKCYKIYDVTYSKADGLKKCQDDFPFTSDRDKIRLAELRTKDDAIALYRVMKSKNNMDKIWLSANPLNAATNRYDWADKTPIDANELSKLVNGMKLGGDCLTFEYKIVQPNIEYNINSSTSCSSKLTTVCEHNAVTCGESGINGFDPVTMQLNSFQKAIGVVSHLACKMGFYRDEELLNIPNYDSSSNTLPQNYVRCTGAESSDKNPFKFESKWESDTRMSTCKAIACSKFNGTLYNVEKMIPPPDSNSDSYAFGLQFKVQCSKGYVDFSDPTKTESAMTCSQSPLDKKVGVWSPENNQPCKPVKCNNEEIETFSPIRGRLFSAINKQSQKKIDVVFSKSQLPFYDNVLTIRCDDGYFFPDRNWEKQILCNLKDNSLTEGVWKGYVGTMLPLPKSCDSVTCKYESILIHSSMNLKTYWFEMNANGVYENKTEQKGDLYQHNAKLRFFCMDGFDTANQTPDQNLTCGEQGLWVPNLTPCIKKTEKLDLGNKKRYIPPPVDAPAAKEVGYVAIVIMVIFLSLIVVLDLSTLARDVKIMRNNIQQLKKRFRKKKSDEKSNN